MHKIQAKKFELNDFSHEHLLEGGLLHLHDTIRLLNEAREIFNNFDYFEPKLEEAHGFKITKKDIWWQMIQLLPTSYNQKLTVHLNYEVLGTIYHQRRHHKLTEWVDFCDMIKTLPYSEFITREFGDKDDM